MKKMFIVVALIAAAAGILTDIQSAPRGGGARPSGASRNVGQARPAGRVAPQGGAVQRNVGRVGGTRFVGGGNGGSSWGWGPSYTNVYVNDYPDDYYYDYDDYYEPGFFGFFGGPTWGHRRVWDDGRYRRLHVFPR